IYTNVFSQESYDDMKLFQGNYFAKYKHNEKFSLQLNLKHQHHRNDGAFPLVMGDEEAFDQPFELDQNAQSTMNDRTFNASLTASYQSQRHGLSSQTSYQDNHRIYKNSIDGDFSSYDIVAIVNRSEEHTSELQSRENLVCRLLLEKKKKKNDTERY